MDEIEITKGTITDLKAGQIATTIVKFGAPDASGKRRSVEFRDTDIVDEWGLAEVTPATAAGSWITASLTAMSVLLVDGVPMAPLSDPPEREQIAGRLKRLGNDGFAAVYKAKVPPPEKKDLTEAEAAHRAQVGNSPDAAASAS